MRAIFLIAVLVLTAAGARAEDPAVPAEITLNRQGHGWILADTKGKTLYVTLGDKNGKSSCEGACAKQWPPVIAPAGAQAFGEWTLVPRTDGSAQWAFNGKPLYTFSADAAPGDQNGDDMEQQWSVALKPLQTPPGFGLLRGPRGQLLVDRQRMSLYTFASDTANSSACTGACARQWKPVEAWWLADVHVPDWSVIDRPDGNRQWAYKGKPLYRYTCDVNPGDLLGANIKGWQPVVLQPSPPVPSWLTVQRSDGGELYADANGMTVYFHMITARRQAGIGFVRTDETPQNWKPCLASDTDKPVGFFSIVANADGQRQWAYKGSLMFTNIYDKRPGEIHGVRSIDRLWRPIMTSGQSMAGSGT